VKVIKLKQPCNPNKWAKTLAPWFNDVCKAAKQKLTETKRTMPKGDISII
jgi:hypothetical protein